MSPRARSSAVRCSQEGEICPETPSVPQKTEFSHGKRGWGEFGAYHLVTVPCQQPVRSHIVRRCRNAKSAPDSNPLKSFQSQIVGMFPERKALFQAKNARKRLLRNPDAVPQVIYFLVHGAGFGGYPAGTRIISCECHPAIHCSLLGRARP